MRLPPFLLEDFFAEFEPACEHNLTSADVEPIAQGEVLALADEEVRGLWEGLNLNYAHTRGHPLLRAEIAAGYEDLDRDGVHVFGGATEAIFALANVLLGPGDHAVVIGPIYQLLADLPAAAGAEVTRADLRVEDGWELDPERVREAITPRTRLIVANFPNNPSGSLPSRAAYEQLVELAARAGAYLLSDEIYRGLDGEDLTLPAGVDCGEHVISVFGMSKVFGMAGARVGWAATRDRNVLEGLRSYRYWTTLCTSAPGELLALIALRAREHLIARGRALIEANRAHLAGFMERHADTLDWVPPRAGTTAFPWLRRGSAQAFSQRLIAEHGVFLAPASVLPAPGEHLRFGLGRRGFAAGLERLDAAVRATPLG